MSLENNKCMAYDNFVPRLSLSSGSFVFGRKTLVTVGNVITCGTNVSTGVELSKQPQLK